MANQIKSVPRPATPVVIHETGAEFVRVILIVLIWAYGFHLATRFASSDSTTSPAISVTAASQLPSFDPVAGDWKFEMDTNDPVSRLLPLPEDTRTLCRRIGADHTVQMEIVTVNSTRQQILDLWQSAGWIVQPAPHERTGTFACYCGRGDEFVYAWSGSKTNRIETLMLVNSPHTGKPAH